MTSTLKMGDYISRVIKDVDGCTMLSYLDIINQVFAWVKWFEVILAVPSDVVFSNDC
jgi:hypothetical protein